MNASYWKKQLQEWQKTDVLSERLPEVSALKGVAQPRIFHAEGDALTHTLMAIEAVSPDADIRVFWAVLLHDTGKATTTKFINGRWRAHGHVKQSTLIVPTVLERFQLSEISDDVSWLVKHHHFTLDWGDSALKGLTKKQLRFCNSELFSLLTEVCRADEAASLGASDKGERLDQILKATQRLK